MTACCVRSFAKKGVRERFLRGRRGERHTCETCGRRYGVCLRLRNGHAFPTWFPLTPPPRVAAAPAVTIAGSETRVCTWPRPSCQPPPAAAALRCFNEASGIPRDAHIRALVVSGASYRAIAALEGISVSTVQRAVGGAAHRQRDSGRAAERQARRKRLARATLSCLLATLCCSSAFAQATRVIQGTSPWVVSFGASTPAVTLADNAARLLGQVTFVSPQHIICDSGCASPPATPDNSAFTFGTTAVSPIGYVVDDTATNNVTENSYGAPRMSTTRLAYSDLSKSLSNTNSFKVDFGGASQPVTVATLVTDQSVAGGALSVLPSASLLHVWNGDTALWVPVIDGGGGRLQASLPYDVDAGVTLGNTLRVTLATNSLGMVGGTQTSDTVMDYEGNHVSVSAFVVDETTPSTATENNVGPARMSPTRAVYTSLRDGQGNERSAYVNSSNELRVSIGSSTTPIDVNITGTQGDAQAFGFGTGPVVAPGYVVDELATHLAPEDTQGAPRMTPARVAYADLSKSASNTNLFRVAVASLPPVKATITNTGFAPIPMRLMNPAPLTPDATAANVLPIDVAGAAATLVNAGDVAYVTARGLGSVGVAFLPGPFVGRVVAECSMDSGPSWTPTFFDQADASTVSVLALNAPVAPVQATLSAMGGCAVYRVRVVDAQAGSLVAQLRATMAVDPSVLFTAPIGSANVPPAADVIAGVDATGVVRALAMTSGGAPIVQLAAAPALPRELCNPVRRTNCQPKGY